MSKTLSQRSVAELTQLFDEFAINFPDSEEAPTKKELLSELAEAGITNSVIKEWESKAESADELNVDEEELVTGDVVVQMNRNNSLFSWKKYRFTTETRFLPMPREDAFELIQEYDGFRIASREEIKRYFR